MSHLQDFLESIKTNLPEISTEKDLVLHIPCIFRSLATVHRMRKRKQVPSHLFIEPNFYYLKGDVIDWLRAWYQNMPTQPANTSSARCQKEDHPDQVQFKF